MSHASNETKRLRATAAYMLRVTHPTKNPADPGLAGVKDGIMRLPRSPLHVDYADASRHATHPTGVNELLVDAQGRNPPLITITFTFGERGARQGATDASMDGRAWHRAAEGLVTWFLETVARSGRAREPLHELEWHDTYTNHHWVVHPLATPYGARDSARPVTEEGTLRLQAVRRADRVTPPRDALLSALGNPALNCPFAPACGAGGPRTSGCLLYGSDA